MEIIDWSHFLIQNDVLKVTVASELNILEAIYKINRFIDTIGNENFKIIIFHKSEFLILDSLYFKDDTKHYVLIYKHFGWKNPIDK